MALDTQLLASSPAGTLLCSVATDPLVSLSLLFFLCHSASLTDTQSPGFPSMLHPNPFLSRRICGSQASGAGYLIGHGLTNRGAASGQVLSLGPIS